MKDVSNFIDSIIRIKDKNGFVVGCGFYIYDRYFVTCAHVITAAVYGHTDQELIQERPEEDILCNFVSVGNQDALEAIVIRWSPYKDLALLAFTSPVTKTKDHKNSNLSLKQIEVWDHPIRAFGYPFTLSPEGVWAAGLLRGYTETNKIQVDWNQKGGYPISQGFSGTPVFDNIRNCVVGIVEKVDESANTAFVIPLETIFEEFIGILTKLTLGHLGKGTTSSLSKYALKIIKNISVPITVAGLIHYIDETEMDVLEASGGFDEDLSPFDEDITTEVEAPIFVDEIYQPEQVLTEQVIDIQKEAPDSFEEHLSELQDDDDLFLDSI
ncbi:MAG: trypsin-like peptidase domain-containing protein [Ardenticatenaceae bacterium]|nr:trypsin-like peptidase domain-containing protein [Ardenticatenaceae bacterium]